MIKKIRKNLIAILFILALAAPGFGLVGVNLAEAQANILWGGQAGNVSNAIGLGNQDPRIMVANIIRVSLGLLGIIALIIVVYAGWLWMTAGGNPEQVDKAKKALTGAVIGLVIILSSFAITTYVLNRLYSAVTDGGGGGGACAPIGDNQSCGPDCDGDGTLDGTRYCLDDGSGVTGYWGGCDVTSCPSGPGPGTPCNAFGMPLCTPDDTICAAAGYDQCNPTSCVCENLSGLGDPCNATTTIGVCLADDTKCAPGLKCDDGSNPSVLDCTCYGAPIIDWISPDDGGSPPAPLGTPGNLMTIGGRYFGVATGTVTFLGADGVPGGGDDAVATFPDTVNPACAGYWTDSQIIIVIPAGADGPIRVERPDTEFDDTVNSRGQIFSYFNNDGIVRPGLCLVENTQAGSSCLGNDCGYFDDTFNLQGINFGPFTVSQTIKFGNLTGSSSANNIAFAGSNLSADATVPNLKPMKTTVFAEVDGVASNFLNFQVFFDSSKGPLISYINPPQGNRQDYITIYGSGFQSYQAGSSKVEFTYGSITRLADMVFPPACQGKFWYDKYIIVKVPNTITPPFGVDWDVTVTTKDGQTSPPEPFLVKGGAPGPGLCGLFPYNGPVGTNVTAYGERFGPGGGSSAANYFNGISGTISSWMVGEVVSVVPPGAQTGPFEIVDSGGGVSNSLNFTVGNCTDDSQCSGADICCPAGTYWEGICNPSGFCDSGAPVSSAFGWSFSTSLSTTTPATCGGYKTAAACLGAGGCPNSPGECSTAVATSTGVACDDAACSALDPILCPTAADCAYDSLLDKCRINGSSCDTASNTILSGYTAVCRTVGGTAVWQVDREGGSCPAGTYWDSNNKQCTVGSLGSPAVCDLCAAGSSCVAGECVVDTKVCPAGSVCDTALGECYTAPSCDCCCRTDPAYANLDCCAGLTCEPGGCGMGAPDYGLCTGCTVDLDGDGAINSAEQTLSDQACNCSGTTGKICDTTAAGGLGACVDSTATTTPPITCSPPNDLCDDGSCCSVACVDDGTGATICPGSVGAAGSPCQDLSNPACTATSTTSCLTDYTCLADGSGVDCRCCCDPGIPPIIPADTNAAGLSCVANKGDCTGSSRGLYCGCSADSECEVISPTTLGCGSDTCCRSRPSVASTTPADTNTGVCLNPLITATFDQPMNTASFHGNIIVAGDYGLSTCPAGTSYIALGEPERGNIFVRVFHKIKEMLAKLAAPFSKSASAYTAPSVSSVFCAVPGLVSGYNNAAGEGVITFSPTIALDKNRLYYVIIKGDKNLDSGNGVLNSYNIGMVESNSEVFSGISFANAKIWQFTTGSQVCELDYVEISPSSYLFQTSLDDVDIDPLAATACSDDDSLTGGCFDTINDRDKAFYAYARSGDGQGLASIPGVYEWGWTWSADDVSVASVTPLIVSSASTSLARVEARNKKDAQTYVNAEAVITVDNINANSTVGDSESDRARVRVFLCANPWPPVTNPANWPWHDSDSNCTPGLAGAGCNDTAFEFYYCRDDAGEGTADDMPAILVNPVVRGDFTGSNDILKEFFFMREDMPDTASASSSVWAGPFSTAPAGGVIMVTWSPLTTSPLPDSYRVYYGTSPGVYSDFVDASCLIGPSCMKNISGLTNGVTYYFTVTAYYSSSGAESGYFNEVSAVPADTVPPSAPLNVVSSIGDRRVDLSWDANTDDTVGYKVYWGTSPGVYGASLDVGDSTSASVTNLINGVIYFVTVVAYDAAGNESSGPLNERAVQPQAGGGVVYTGVLDSVDFESFPLSACLTGAKNSGFGAFGDWRETDKAFSNVCVTNAQAFQGSAQSIAITQEPNVEYTGTCNAATCAQISTQFPGRCTWLTGSTNQCEFNNISYDTAVRGVTDCSTKKGYIPVYYNEGEDLCSGHFNYVNYADLNYNVSSLGWTKGNDYIITFYYRGVLSSDMEIQLAYDLSWSSQCTYDRNSWAGCKGGKYCTGAQGRCYGGGSSGWCQGDYDCPGGVCRTKVCRNAAGEATNNFCVSDADCGSGACSITPTGRCSIGSGNQNAYCNVDADCVDAGSGAACDAFCCAQAPAQTSCYPVVKLGTIPAGVYDSGPYNGWELFMGNFTYSTSTAGLFDSSGNLKNEVGLRINNTDTTAVNSDFYIDNFIVYEAAP